MNEKNGENREKDNLMDLDREPGANFLRMRSAADVRPNRHPNGDEYASPYANTAADGYTRTFSHFHPGANKHLTTPASNATASSSPTDRHAVGRTVRAGVLHQ